jgi:hypothetical protein
MILDDIPLTDAPGTAARPSQIVARIRRHRPSRRSIIKGLLVAAAAATLVPLDWLLTRRAASAAGATSEFGDCAPTHYDEQPSNWWKEDSPSAICYGGWRRGGLPCSDGFHREGAFTSRGESYTSTRMTVTCEGRNAWRWQGYRCSDALTETTFDDGEVYEGITISACQLTRTEPPAPGYTAPPEEESSAPPGEPETAETPTDESGDGELLHPGGLLPGRR